MYSTWSESLSPPSHHPSASRPWRAAWLVDSGSSKPSSCGKQGRCWQLIWRLEWRVKQLKRVEIPDGHLACSWSWSTDTPARGWGQTRNPVLNTILKSWDFTLEASGSWSVILEPGIGASPRNLTDTQILGTTLDPQNHKLQGGTQHFVLTSPQETFTSFTGV